MNTLDSSNLPPKVSHIAVHTLIVAQGTTKGYTQRPGELGSMLGLTCPGLYTDAAAAVAIASVSKEANRLVSQADRRPLPSRISLQQGVQPWTRSKPLLPVHTLAGTNVVESSTALSMILA